MKWLLALLALGFAAALHADTPDTAIAALIAREMPASGAPGLAYAIVEGGHIRASARGVVRIGSGERVTPDTPFVLGSITKSLTALAVLQLAEAGKVDLDTGIARYLKAFENRAGQAITIRQLLSHTSGLSMLQGNTSHADPSDGDDPLSRAVTRIAQEPLAYPPGSHWEYSNANYQILGALIEELSGERYAHYIDAHIFRPIGMRHSFVSGGGAEFKMASGHRPWFGGKRSFANSKTERGIAPAGGVIASAGDVARYLAVMMNGADDVLSASGKAAMMRPASEASPFYGLGWFLDTAQGKVFHSGASPGVETLATMLPAQQRAVVVLVNAGSGVGFGETAALREGLSAKALGLDYAGEGSRWQQKTLFVALILLPVGFALSIAWAWFHRAQLRAKSGAFGLFSLWFPLFTTLAMAWALVYLFPRVYGVSNATLRLFQPDLSLALIAGAATGVAWALFRLVLAYSAGGRGSAA